MSWAAGWPIGEDTAGALGQERGKLSPDEGHVEARPAPWCCDSLAVSQPCRHSLWQEVGTHLRPDNEAVMKAAAWDWDWV